MSTSAFSWSPPSHRQFRLSSQRAHRSGFRSLPLPYHICVLSRGALLSSAAAPGRWSWSEGMEQKRKVVEARKQARPVKTRSRFQESLEGFLSVCPLRTSQRLPHADRRFHPQLRFFFLIVCICVCLCVSAGRVCHNIGIADTGRHFVTQFLSSTLI